VKHCALILQKVKTMEFKKSDKSDCGSNPTHFLQQSAADNK